MSYRDYNQFQNAIQNASDGHFVIYYRVISNTYVFAIFQQIVEEAGGVVTRMDGGEFTVFDRSVLVSNGVVHGQVCS